MAKKKKGKKKSNKAKFKGVASKDVRKRYRKSKSQWEKTKGKKPKKAKKAYKRMKSTRKEVKRREQKQYEKARLDMTRDVYGSDDFKLLSPSQQATIRTMVKEFEPDMIKDYGIGPKQRKRLWKEAKKAAREKYGKLIDRADDDYGETLKGDIQDFRREMGYAQDDLAKALDENNSYAAEQIKAHQRILGDSVTEATGRYQTYVDNKKDYLEKQISDMQEQLDVGLGRLSEDEVTKMRGIERDFTKNLDALQNDMAQMGMAFSSKRFKEEDYLGETTAEQRMLAERTTTRGTEDLQRDLGLESQDWARRMTADEVAAKAAEYGTDLRGYVQTAEQQMGTEKAKSILDPASWQYLIGGQTGSINWNQQQAIDEAQTGYERTLAREGDKFTGDYGTEEWNKQFGTAYSSAAGGYTPQQDVVGTEKTIYDRYLEDQEQAELDWRQEEYDVQVGNVNTNI